jgi:tRNA (mo5U34)-methyltransferase
MPLRTLLQRVVRRLGKPAEEPVAEQPQPRDGYAEGRLSLPRIEMLPDDELDRLNSLLPWSAFIVDGKGRRFGNWFSSSKRNKPNAIPDPRIVELDRRIPLAGRHVLELGCFEGIHTAALCERAERVTAVDGRIEHVAKTLVRCGLLGHHPNCFYWDVETPIPSELPAEWDVLHHVGVLYHLAEPVQHLQSLLPRIRRAVLLDTHIATPADQLLVGEAAGFTYRYRYWEEGPRANPFAGLRSNARWLLESDLERILSHHGFGRVEVTERRDERNGPRICLYATRET